MRIVFSFVLFVILCGQMSAQTFNFECYGGFLTGADCQICTGQTSARLFNGLIIRRGANVEKLIDCPYYVKRQGNNLVFTELIPGGETFTANLLSTGYSTITGFMDSTACMCARQDSSWLDGGGGATDLSYTGSSSPVTLNSSTGTDVTVTGGVAVLLSATSSNMTISADTSILATINDINEINCRWCSVKKAMPFYSNNPQTAFEALRTYWASRMGEIVVDTTVLLTANTTVAAAIRFVGGGNIDIDAGHTLTFSSSVEAEPKQFIFTGDGTYAFNAKSVAQLYPYWFGAVGDAVTDDYAAIQKTIDAAISSKVAYVRLLSGAHVISQGLLVRATSGTTTFTMEGVMDYDSNPATAIYCNDTTSFAIGIQSARAVAIRNMYIAGLNRSFSPSTANVISYTNAQWRSTLGRDSRYSPFAGIVVDPFKNGAPADGGYPGFASQYSLTQGTSTNLNFENVVIRFFTVGIMVSPSGVNALGSEIKIGNVTIARCRVGVATGGTQNRSVDMVDCKVAFVASGVDASSYGNQAAPMPRVIGGQFTFLKDILIAPASFGGGPLLGVYGESVYRIGSWSGLSGEVLSFKDCEIKLVSNENSGTTSPASILDATGAKIMFVGGSIYQSTYAPVEMNVRELFLKGVRIARPIINNPNGNSNESRVYYEGCQIDGYNLEQRFSYVSPVILGKDLQRAYGNLEIPGQTVSYYEAGTNNDNTAVFTNLNDAEDHNVLLSSSIAVTIDTTAMTATFAPSNPERYRVGDILFSSTNLSSSTPAATSKASTFGIVTSVGATDVVCSRIPGGIVSGTYNVYLWAERIFTGTYLANITSGSNKCVIVSKNTGNPTLSQVWKAGTRVFAKSNQSPTSGLYTGLYVVSVTADTLYLSGNVGSTVSNLEIFCADYRGVYYSYDNTYQTGASTNRTVGYQTGDEIVFASHAYRAKAIVTAGGFTPTVKFLFKKLQGLSASKPTPTSADEGLTYFSTDTGILEIWDGSAWQAASPDNSTTNELQTLANTSDATSHTVTLSDGGGSVQLIEGSNITLTTGGTGLDGTVTIAAASAAGTDLSYTGSSSPVTLNSSTGTDVTITEGTGITLAATSSNLTVSAKPYHYSSTRTLPTTVGNTVQLGFFTQVRGVGNYEIMLEAEASGVAVSKYYLVSSYYSSTAGVWQILPPISSTGAFASQDFVLEIKGTTTIDSLRVRRTSGTTAATLDVDINYAAQGTVTFTPLSGTDNPTAITAVYNLGALAQMANKVGIKTIAPAQDFHVEGTARITGSSGTPTAVTGRNASGDISNLTLATGLSISGGALTPADNSATNEIQTITGSGSGTTYALDLSLSGGSIGLIEGTGITIDRTGNDFTFNSSGVGTVYYQTMRDDGTDKTQRGALNFVSSATVAATLNDDAGNDETEVTLSVPTDGITATEIAAGAVGTSEIADNSVANADFRQSTALSVVGNPTNATANVQDIAAASDNQVLRRSGTALAFGAVNLASGNAVTGILPVTNGGTGLSTLATNRIPYGNGTSAFQSSANLTFDGTTLAIIGKQTWAIGGTYTTSQNFAYMNGTVTSTANSLTHYGFFIDPTFTNDGTVTGNTYFGARIRNTISGASTQASAVYGLFAGASSSSANASTLYGTYSQVSEGYTGGSLNNRMAGRYEALFTGAADLHTGTGFRGDVTATNASGRWATGYGTYLAVTNAKDAYGGEIVMTNSRLTANNQRGIRIQNNVSGSGVVVDAAYGIELRSTASSSGIITNYYGLYQTSIPTGATNTYFLYGSQTGAKSYHAGNFGIGSGSSSPAQTLHVQGTARITGSDGTATTVTGRDGDGDISSLSLTDELAINSGTLGTNFSTTITPSTLTAGLTNNWNPTGLSTAWIIELSGDASFQAISGITAPSFNKRLTLRNTGTNNIVLLNASTSSTAANRFAFNRDVLLFAGQSIEVMYSTANSRWMLIAGECFEKAQQYYFNSTFNAPVSGSSGDYSFWEISSPSISGIAPQPGLFAAVGVNTGSSSSGCGYVASKDAFFENTNASGSADWAYCKAVVKTPSSLSDGTDDYTIRIGFIAGTCGGSALDGMYFDYNHANVSGDWGCNTTNAGNTQRNDSGIAVATSTTYVLELMFRPFGVVEYFINGTRVATNDTFVPYATGDDMYVVAEIEKSLGTNSREIQVFTLQTSVAIVNQP